MQFGLFIWVIYYIGVMVVEPPCELNKFSGFFFFPLFAFYSIRAAKLVFQWEISTKLNQFNALPRAKKTTEELYSGKGGFFVRHRKWIAPKRLFIVAVIYILIHLMLALINSFTSCPETCSPGSAQCALTNSRLILLFVVEACVVVIPICCHVHRGQDALKVKLELGLILLIIVLAVIGTFIIFFSATLAATLTFVCFAFTLSACFTIWFPIVLDLQMNIRHESRPVKFTLATILADPAGFQSVAAFLKLEFSAENAYFYQRVEEYRDPVNRGEGAAEYLYDTFIASNSPFQVNLSADIVQNIALQLGKPVEQDKEKSSLSFFTTTRSIRSVSSTSALDMKTREVAHRRTGSGLNISQEDLMSLFDAAQAEVLQLMMRDSWVRYLQSTQFAEYAQTHKDAASVLDSVMRSSRLADSKGDHPSKSERESDNNL